MADDRIPSHVRSMLEASERVKPTSGAELLEHPGYETDPFVLCGLLRFRGVTGAENFFEAFWKGAIRVSEAHGARWLWSARITDSIGLGDYADWDYINLVWYPSRKVFLEMLQDPAYVAFHQERREGLETTELLLLSELPLEGQDPA